MPTLGGEARRVTELPEGVEDYAWSPDGKRLAVIAWDPVRPAGAPKPKHPPPIVTDRYWFKEDGTGYLDHRRRHLYVVDVATGKAELLTPGDHDEDLPAWSPDGTQIAYVTKRGADPDRHLNFDIYLIEPRAGAVERQLTHFEGADLDPDWETRPAWSPDGKRIAYLQGGEDKWVYYAPARLAVVDVASGKETLATDLDRWFAKPRWSKDGRSLYVLVEESRVTHLSKVTLDDKRVAPLTSGPRLDVDFAVSGDRLVVLGGGDDRPADLAAVEPRGLRALGAHNEWLAGKRLAPVEDVSFKSADGTEIHGFLVKPLDYVAGRRYPTILRLHGGPVYQYSHEFMPDWQAYAAAGYAVIAPNPRGSSGRGFDFARAIYADWGNKDVQDVLAAVDHVGGTRRRRPGAARRRRAQLRRHPHQLRHRQRRAVQGGGERGGRVELHGPVRPRHVHPRVRTRAWVAVAHARGVGPAELSVPAGRAHRDADAVSTARSRTSTCPARAPSRCTRRCARATCRRSSSSIRARTTASRCRATCATGSSG